MAENRIDQALSELTRLGSTDEALAVLKALDQKRRERYFIKYWQPYQKQGEALVQFTGDLKVFGLLGGNRSGKTELGVFVVLAFALGRDFFKGEPAWEFVKDLPIPDKPCNIWIVGLDFSMLRDVIWREKIRQALGRQHPGAIALLIIRAAVDQRTAVGRRRIVAPGKRAQAPEEVGIDRFAGFDLNGKHTVRKLDEQVDLVAIAVAVEVQCRTAGAVPEELERFDDDQVFEQRPAQRVREHVGLALNAE